MLESVNSKFDLILFKFFLSDNDGLCDLIRVDVFLVFELLKGILFVDMRLRFRFCGVGVCCWSAAHDDYSMEI